MPSSQSPRLTPGRRTPVVVLADCLEKPSLDDRDYRVVRLENELEVLLVHDPETDKASAALDVNVGNFSDEEGMPGMAHAVEHLLFMGTKKFPVENDYNQYLAANSGSSNAYTASTSTNYFFDIAAKPANDEDPSDTNPSPLRGALDRFAQFFVEPLFLPSTLDRELKAVDSENKKNLQNDTWRLHQLGKSLSNPRHPFCHFSTGNLNVLKTLPEARGINVRDKFIEFHDKHYSANRMKLVVLGREPLDVLQKWVVELFSPIANKKLPPNRWSEEVPFRDCDMATQCFAKPVMDTRQLDLTFPFMDEEALFESQPSRYISHLIGHEGPGSIMSYVKNKGWVNGLSAWSSSVCPGTPGMFEVQIRLTEEGLNNYHEIANIFFQYVSLLREASPQEWIFDEQKGMADVDFKFRQKTPASRFTSRTSSVMQKPLPREWLLSGNSRLRTFDAELIEKALSTIRPDKLRMTVVSRTFPGNWDAKEKWYGTEYRCEKIPDDLMAELNRAMTLSASERLPELHLPHKNNFIPKKLEVDKKEVAEPAPAPRVLRNDSLARTWWKKDDTFWVPKANVMVSLKNPIIHATAENSVKARIFTELVRDEFEEYSYDAELAGLQYTVSLDSRGLFLDISGYNDKLPVLLKQVVVTIRDLDIRTERFDIVKERLTRGYKNFQLQSSYQQIGDYASWLNAERDYIVEELEAELSAITVDAVRLFHRQMLAQLYIEIYAHGNLYRDEALMVTDMVVSTFKARPLPRWQCPVIRSLMLPPGSNFVYNKTLEDPANVNHCVETWFFVGDKADGLVRAKTLLVDQMTHEPAFDQLRTKEQLGYIVFSGIRNFATTCGFRVLIQSEKTPEYLEKRIEAFMAQFSRTLATMSEAEFEGHKRSLIIRRLEKLRSLDQESSRHWGHISNEYYDFEQAQVDAANIKSLTKAEMVDFYDEFLSPSSSRRARLSVHLHARGAGELDMKVMDLLRASGVDDVPQANRSCLALLEGYLKDVAKVPTDRREVMIRQARELGLEPTAQSGESEGEESVGPALALAKEITDVRRYRAGLPIDATSSPDCLCRIHLSPAFVSELPGQLTVKTPSSKKRKLARPPSTTNSSSLSPDTALPSCEADDDAVFSLAPSVASGLNTPLFSRADSLPASSLPARLQTQAASLVSAEYASSVASSSPCASACADLSLESDRGGEEAGSALSLTRSQSPLRLSRRAIMSADDELPRRSSSPLKRRASGMDSEMNTCRDSEAATSFTVDGDGSSSGLHPRSMSIDPPELNGRAEAHTPPHPAPPLQEQIKVIEMLLKASSETPLVEGSTAYLVSRSWLEQALAMRTDSKSAAEAPLGPVDNSDIIEEVIRDSNDTDFVRLKPGLGLESFELFPEDAWKLVMEWYGLREGQHPIVRTAVNTAENIQDPPNIMYEFHPPVFRIYRLWSKVSPLPIEQALKEENPPAIIMVRSFTAHAQTFLKDLKTLAGIPMDRKVRIFSVPLHVAAQSAEPMATLTPPDSPAGQRFPSAWRDMLLDIVSFSEVQDSKTSINMTDQTANGKFNGKATLRVFLNPSDQNLVVDEAIGDSWVSTYNGQNVAGKSIPSRVNVAAQSSKPNSIRSSPCEGVLTRARAQKKRPGRNAGAVGLHNLGNTCYMNSALQCVRSVEELSKYFLTESHLPEINDTNVLGYDGRVAIAYGSLLREVYEDGRGAVSPRDFKSTVGRCRPTFSGWGQQDSQEFLGFLLDALQEDLSRIKKKPYIEKPDSTDDMINKPEAIREMAAQVWDITRRRDASVIADLFTGMYKSTLKCPECGKISITFDPFNNLTLPLPAENVWTKQVKFFPLNDVPVKLDVELPKHGSVESLKEFVSARTGVPANRLMGAEEFKNRFFKFYDNGQSVVEEIPKTDMPTIHELEAVPTNWPCKNPRKKYRSMLDVDSPLDSVEYDEEQSEIMVVSVLHRRPHTGGPGPDEVCPPHFVTLTRKEACSLDIIKRKVLERVATFTTWPKLSETSLENGTSDSTVSSDVDSSGDGKVAARSVDGEDDMIDISMRDAGGRVSGQASPLKRFNRRRPRFADADVFLDPELQNLFELCFFRSNSDGPVPTGWSVFENDTVLEKLSDRVQDCTDHNSFESPDSTLSGNEDNSNEDNSNEDETGAPLTRMTEELSDEDASPAPRFMGRHGRQSQKGGGRKKFKGHKTYGKKGNKRRDKQARAPKTSQRAQAAVSPQPMPRAVPDGGPLIRPYEGIVVDWNEEVWDLVFGNTTRGTMGEARTYVDPETLDDPAIRLNQRRRQTRRTSGITLEECLDEFERAEILSEQDMWYCPRCKEHRRASKKFDLWKTPDILVAHLKRFSNAGWRREKLDMLVDFPIENLDLTSRVIEKEDGKVEVYDLIAVDDHYGGLGGGHYTAYAKNFVDGRWYSFNDSAVHIVSDLSSMVTSAAYLLFYRRRSSRPLGGPRFAEISAKYDGEGGASDDEFTETSSDGRDFAAGRQAVRADEDDLPPYTGTIRRSIEVDGDDSSSGYQAAEPKSLDMTQAWSFEALEGRRTQESTGGDCASDDVQFDSSSDDRARGGYFEQDTDMASSAAVDDNASWEGQGVLAVPTHAGSDVDSDAVAEIHIEGVRQ
ncbi:hypothetical protein L249_8413 [Ophiocordyceps polyrhachis-furcata BCC 54312]|uniref:Uncharacterized protein n=1 Tax=Ophiocordyceps polyrhachis-furcata BCC 54312 TaxID=1330021 RepID=A0A367L6W2_9HYPO|nr:hypothetical protein L249_8413 [Ophiocordyceps polyrhachis-furcata BCC 54312]